MTQNNPICWIEVPVADMDRAENFYNNFFGYECNRQPEKGGYEMSFFPMADGYGSTGALIKGEGCVPTKEGANVYFTAPEETVAASLEKAEKLGITVVTPLTDIGEYGFFAAIEDSEGNIISIHSEKG